MLPLARYGSATLNGANAGLSANEEGAMMQGGRVIATPSFPSVEGNAFCVAYGSTPPDPPGG